jgi:hypothetical protein
MYRRVPNQIGSGVERAEMGSEDLRQVRRTTQRKESRGASELAPPLASLSQSYWLLLS